MSRPDSDVLAVDDPYSGLFEFHARDSFKQLFYFGCFHIFYIYGGKMRLHIEKIKIRSEIDAIFTEIVKHCNIPDSHPEYLLRIQNLMRVITLLLDEKVEVLDALQKRMFDLGVSKSNNVQIKCSIALKSAMDMIFEGRDGRDYLISLLKQNKRDLTEKIYARRFSGHQLEEGRIEGLKY